MNGSHAQTAAEVINEQPLLINPASENDDDDPAKHLAIDIATGLMIPLSERGIMCIEIFGLNVRDRLVEERKKACTEILSLWASLSYKSKEDRSQIIEKFKGIQQGKYAYSLAQNTTLLDLLKEIKSIL